MTRQLDTVPTDSDALEAALAEIRRVQEVHWPPEVPRTVEYPIEGRGLVDYLRHWASVRPHAPAIEFYGRTVGYAEYDDLSDRFAGWLLARGAGPATASVSTSATARSSTSRCSGSSRSAPSTCP